MEERVARMATLRQEIAAVAMQQQKDEGQNTGSNVSVDDKVLIWKDTKSHKMEAKWIGPFLVLWKGDHGAIRVRSIGGHRELMLAGHKVKRYWRPPTDDIQQLTTKAPVVATDKRRIGDKEVPEQGKKKPRS